MITAFDALEYQRDLNAEIESWGKLTKDAFLMKIRNLPFKDRVMWQSRKSEEILRGKVGLKLRRYYGDIVRVTFPFTKHGIMQEHGVGKGRKLGSGKEKPNRWIVPTFDAMTPMLSDAMQKEGIKHLGLVIQIKVNGLYEISL